MSDLPDNIKRFDILKIEYGKKKLCQCLNPHYEIDAQNRLVYCTDCKAIIEPYEVLCSLSRHYSRIESQVEGMLKQRKEIANWKPWLLTFRNLESQYRGGKILPLCPNCTEPFYFEKVNCWTSRQLHEKRMEREKGEVEK